MADAADLEEIACGLEGTQSHPHFDRKAFKARRIYATLAADGRTANLKLAPDEQELKCLTHPGAFSPVPGGWGRQGWTTCNLSQVTRAELASALAAAHADATAVRRNR